MARIFVADDNPHVLRIVEDTLAAEGHEVIGVSDGSGALGTIARTVPDLVLLDTTLPGENAFEICRGILSQEGLDASRLVLLAGPLETVNDSEASQAGVYQVLQKPVDAAMLESLVADLPPPPATQAPPTVVDQGQIIDALVHEALGRGASGPSREAIREQIEAVVTDAMPAIIDRITDRLIARLRNLQ